MNNRRSIVRLLAAAVLLGGAHAALTFRGGNAERLLPRRSLSDDTFAVTDITLCRRGEPVTALRKADAWRLASPYDAGVEQQTVMRFLDALNYAPLGERVSDAELLKLGRTRADFGLEPAQLTVILSDGEKKALLSFGGATPGGDGVYAAVDGVDTVFTFASNAFVAVNRTAADFRRRALVGDGQADVDAFDLKRGSTSLLRFTRTGAAWSLADPVRPASASAVKALLKDVFLAEAVDFVWPVGAPDEAKGVSEALLAGFGLDPESAVTATFKCADGTDRYVSFGKEAGAGLVYALAQNGTAVVKVSAALKAQAAADAGVFTDTRLFPLEAAAVASVSVTDGETTYLLARADDGAWRLDAPVSAPADKAAAEAFVARLLKLKSGDRAAAGLTVSLGTNAAPVVVARAALLGRARLEDLRAKNVLNVSATDIRRLVVTADGARTAVVRDRERGSWNLERGDGKAVLDRRALDALLRTLAPLKASGVVQLKVSASELPRYGLATPRLVVAIDLEQEDALRRNVLVGDETEGGAYATVGSSDAVFVLPSAAVRALSAPLVGK